MTIEVTDEMRKVMIDTIIDRNATIEPDATIKRIIELHEANKWVKFDANDESTYPQIKGHHIAFDGRYVSYRYWSNTGENKRSVNQSWFVSESASSKKVTNWQYLPKFNGQAK